MTFNFFAATSLVIFSLMHWCYFLVLFLYNDWCFLHWHSLCCILLIIIILSGSSDIAIFNIWCFYHKMSLFIFKFFLNFIRRAEFSIKIRLLSIYFSFSHSLGNTAEAGCHLLWNYWQIFWFEGIFFHFTITLNLTGCLIFR